MLSSCPAIHDAEAPRTRPAKSKPRLVVELRSRPAPYEPGSGPPLLPVTLMPDHDSTAFIVDRILLASPGLAKDGQALPRRMTYIVGWSDLPAARVLVPAMKVLEYVSPWVLEEWEYNFELELEDERAKLAEDKEREKRERAQQPQEDGAVDNAKVKKTKGKKRGRPPTHKNTQIEAGAVALPETDDEASRTRMKPGTMSLSTPQKTRLADFEDLSEEEGTPTRQTQPSPWNGAASLESESANVDVASNPMTGLKAQGRTFQQQVESFRPLKMTPVPLPSFPRSNVSGQQRTLPGMFATKNMGSAISSAESSKSTTPVSLPVLPPLRPAQSLPQAPSIRRSSEAWTSYQDAGRATSQPTVTPVPPPLVPPSASSTPSITSRPTSSKSQTTTSKPPRKRRRKDKPLLDESGLPVWVVKRIEDDGLFEIEGQGVQRLYKVRWEGDWPPEENPTWEPAANLPPNMVRNWHKTAPKVRARLSKGLSDRKHGGRTQSSALTIKKDGKLKQSKLTWPGGQKIYSVGDVMENELDAWQNSHQATNDDTEMELDETREETQRNGEQNAELFSLDEATGTGVGKNLNSSEPGSEERSSLAKRMSSWGAFFGGR
ncbi:hypothetical protein NLU13_0975 [Sarocladium strictum]|uniref:Chromo domain-containing protein n=1 Tax=Sarocladium strictum TaxID=5046 RepID=A0AA39LC09_SARSR|nr:hypothetical protein NLU13_0975 [Sarocladium strictum]